jgi:hypothetical protein
MGILDPERNVITYVNAGIILLLLSVRREE